MSLIASPLPACVGVDLNTKLTATSAKALAEATWQNKPIKFCWRYISIHEPEQSYDITAQELADITDAGLTCLLIQHPRNPGVLVASADQGRIDGTAAANNAAAVGYPKGCHLGLDMEGLKQTGQPVQDYINAWALAVIALGYQVCLYVGYACGLNSYELYHALPNVHCYWSDFGQRKLDARGFSCKQYMQTRIAGLIVDPDEAFPDAFQGVLVGAVKAPDMNIETVDNAQGAEGLVS